MSEIDAMENWHRQERCPYDTPSGICTRDRQGQHCLCRPAPSQSDEERADAYLARGWDQACRDQFAIEFAGQKGTLLAEFTAVRAEATLAGAAAEREACEAICDEKNAAMIAGDKYQHGYWDACNEIKGAIRARKP